MGAMAANPIGAPKAADTLQGLGPVRAAPHGNAANIAPREWTDRQQFHVCKRMDYICSLIIAFVCCEPLLQEC